ncbi:MFS monocarboxylate transporter [Botrytis cinerea]
MFLSFWGLYFAFFYLGTFARDRLGATTETSVSLLMILNGIGIAGRIIPNLIGDRITGPFNIVTPLSFAACLLIYCWAAVDSIHGMYAFAIIYGFIAAALQALFPATATTLTTDPEKTGVRLGMILSVVGFACLTGPPISGALIQAGGEVIFMRRSLQEHRLRLVYCVLQLRGYQRLDGVG